MRIISIMFFLVFLLGCNKEEISSADEAIVRVENCICYKSAEGQQLKPWELSWDDSDQLKKQFSHCECKAHIDLEKVKNPKRYVVPGTEVR